MPFLASGASLGIEDAYLLARILGHPLTKNSNIEASAVPVFLGLE